MGGGVFLFLMLFLVFSRKFHSYGNVNIADEGYETKTYVTFMAIEGSILLCVTPIVFGIYNFLYLAMRNWLRTRIIKNQNM